MMSEFEELVAIMARLRGEGGCPWDREQTHASLRAHLIEESAEVLEAIESGDARALCEELGDLLLQVVFHAQIAGEGGEFSIRDVIEGLNAKLVRRHPHISASDAGESGRGDQGLDSAQVLSNWEAIKAREKSERAQPAAGALDGVPPEMAALATSFKISKKAAKLGFEWPDRAGVLDKLAEEARELEEAIARDEGRERVAEEMGDLLFTAVNVARWSGVNPELALRDANAKFRRRFALVEAAAKARGQSLESLSPREWDDLWRAAKSPEQNAPQTPALRALNSGVPEPRTPGSGPVS